MPSIEPDRLAEQVHVALKATFSDLICANRDLTFYAFALWTDDSLQFLNAAVNTEEALASTVKRYQETVDPKFGRTSTRANMRWAYGDWGFFPAPGEEYFDEINEALRVNFDSDDETFQAGVDLFWPAILRGFQRLDDERFFESGAERSRITLLVVGNLPDELVESWVLALNPPDVADRYINWNYDALDGTSKNG